MYINMCVNVYYVNNVPINDFSVKIKGNLTKCGTNLHCVDIFLPDKDPRKKTRYLEK